jgi:DNA-binding response OmpR family regulator
MQQVLIVEDEVTLANGIKLALQTEQIGVFICRTIAEARQAMTKQEFHLLLLDINLPDGSGLDFLQEVRKTSQVPTICLTANDMEIDIVTGLEMGADDYVTKPFSLAVLRARVHTQLRRSEQRQDTVIEIDDFSFDFLRMIFKRACNLTNK